MDNKKDFKPFISADKIVPEFTFTSLFIGILLAVVFGAANAYLGLRVGMTVSASIPAAVLSMGIIRVILRRDSILENNMVQTIGSAGESVAAGAIFTLPALFLWAADGVEGIEAPGLFEIFLIALVGGTLGVLFMIPLRKALIVEEHGVLPYPEGTACADVLLAGEEGGANASTVFSGMGLAAIFKFVVDGLKLLPADVSAAFKSFKGEIGMEVYPALLGVGYIVATDISKDGTLIGPNFEMYDEIAKNSQIQFVVSGGIKDFDNIQKVAQKDYYACIVGKAYYEKKIDLKETIKCLQNV